MDEAITQDELIGVFIDKMSESPVGVALICVVALILILLPVFKSLYTVYKDKKAEKAELEKQRKEEEEKQKRETLEFRKRIEDTIQHIPQLDIQIASLKEEVKSIKELKDEWTDSTKTIQQSINDLSKDIKEISRNSIDGDRSIRQELKETREMVQVLSTSTKRIEDNVNIIIEGDVNEFRTYIMQLHTKHVHDKIPITREIKQELRVKYETYSKEGGNSWASDLYKDIMVIPISSDYAHELPESIVNGEISKFHI